MHHPTSPPAHPVPALGAPQARSTFPPAFLWLLLQIAALGVSAARVPFYAKSFPQPAERLALNGMLVVQTGAAALLFPFLLRDPWAAGIVIATSWPFTIAAGFLTGVPNPWMAAAAAGYVTLWLLGLAFWRPLLVSPRAQAAGIALATLAAFAGPLLWYLRAEYGTATGGSPDLWGPIFGALAVANHEVLQKGPWIAPAACLGAALLVRAVHRLIAPKPG